MQSSPYLNVTVEVDSEEVILEYNPFVDHLYDFYSNTLNEETCPTLSTLILKLLILSRWNAAFERGLSANALLKENLHGASLALLRHVQDGIRRSVWTTEVEISDVLLQLKSCRIHSKDASPLGLGRKGKEHDMGKKINVTQTDESKEDALVQE